MAAPQSFAPAKLIVGIIFRVDSLRERAERELTLLYGDIDLRSPSFPFRQTDYYERQMGEGLERMFLSFAHLVPPEMLSAIKLKTNALEEKIRRDSGETLRAVNIDPGILTGTALIMATAKDFAHRIPLADGIYGHLEFLFSKNDVRILEWTYPDFRQNEYQAYFLEVRRLYLAQRKTLRPAPEI